MSARGGDGDFLFYNTSVCAYDYIRTDQTSISTVLNNKAKQKNLTEMNFSDGLSKTTN